MLNRPSAARTAGAFCMALLLGGCGQREAKTTTSREAVTVSTEAGPMPAAGAANRLLNEQSAFLRRHAQDPVDWYPWGEAAFAKARAEQKLILVSIGYASCPWSQKMQEETFTDGKVARFMNRHYVNILVDREERPDVNNSYLHFLFWKNKQSGWPLHMWLTPEGLPVFSGVYFPVNAEGGSASWSLTMEHVANSFSSDPAYVKKQAELIAREYLKEYRKFWKDSDTILKPTALGFAFDKLRSVYDPVNGGFSGAPKFPQPQALDYLMSYSARIGQDRMGRSLEAKQMLSTTLDAILAGGIYDQLGGGIHRYSNDVYWAVPQFEKMLYDQGFFAETLILAAQTLGKAEYADAARAVLKYADTDLGHPEGGFYCAEGSSSLGAVNAAGLTEGAFYVWSLTDAEAAVGAEAMPLLKLAYGLDERGNIPIDSPSRSRFPGLNVLKMERPFAEVVKLSGKSAAEVTQSLAKAREKLLAARQKRTRPLLDDKVLASWNGTVIAALAQAAWVFDDSALKDRSARAMDFVLKRLRRADGSLVHAFLDGPSTAPGYSEDYAMVIRALLEMYTNSGEERWLTTAAELQDKQVDQLWDKADGGFFDGPAHPLLFNRMKSVDESTEFSPTSVSTLNLIRLSHLLGRPDYLEKARQVISTYGSLMMKSPAGFLRLLQAYADLQTPPLQVVVVGAPNAPDRAEMLAPLRKMVPFGRVILYLDGGPAQAALAEKNPALAKLTAAPGATTTIHLCRNFAPLQSITKAADLGPALEKAMAPPAP
ncbi:MAG: hypothetical protein JWL81_1664 [Verrucomicrobiales bacterium]|nr:hypothetical protein [Verrucomicrobiales bacterium]